jgi:hypothetical protein
MKDKMFKVKMAAIIRTVPEGALKWYLMAGWKVLEEKKNGKSNSEKTTDTPSDI